MWMLTRDIELKDAILDLIDNCLDGVMRTKGRPPQDGDIEYYRGHEVRITISQEQFVIHDNCGGIPYEIAEEYAFRMGKPDEALRENGELPTVGIYGIGMKRAIFKIGTTATVESKTSERSFIVSIPREWQYSGDEEWDFDMAETNIDFQNFGTKITVTDIHDGVKREWEPENNRLKSFTDKLREVITYHYSLVIEKGFKIYVNDIEVEMNPTQLLLTKDEKGIQPFLFQGVYNGVEVKIALGFYKPMMTDEEMDEEVETTRSSKDAGWTVICNDRVVLYNNKDHLTGWGESGIPKYHNQFIGIKGVVIFRSKDPKSLPMTTTKRGIDLSSNVYSIAKEKMKEGLKDFTNYTNRWKGYGNREKEISQKSELVDLKSLLQPIETIRAVHKLEFKKRRGSDAEFYYKPNLALPETEEKTVYIRFSRMNQEIQEIKAHLYDDEEIDIKPGAIGERCFEIVLNEARGQGRNE